MTQNGFGALFIFGSTAFLIAVEYFFGIEYFKGFFLVPILAAYWLGRYSTSFPKDDK